MQYTVLRITQQWLCGAESRNPTPVPLAHDWVALAKGYAVEAGRATTLDELVTQFRRGLAVTGPYLVEVLM